MGGVTIAIEAGYAVCTHQRMHFQLFDALVEELVCFSRQLDKVGGVEREALIIGIGQLASKRQLIRYRIKVLQLLELVLSTPWEYV